MSVVEPVSVDYIQVKKDQVESLSLLAAIDKGCSLVKLLYVSKEDFKAAQNQDLITITLELYLNQYFSYAIDSLLKNVHMPEDPSTGIMKVTGAGCEKEIEMLRERTPFKVTFVDEFFSQASGNRWMLQNVSEAEMLYPKDEFADEIKPVEMKGLWKKVGDKLLSQVSTPETSSTGPFPCVVAFLGSGAGFVKLLEDGQTQLIGGLALGGKSFLGLSKLLLRTKNYNEIIDLAEKGDRRNVDTQMKEIFTNNESSAYGQNDPERPIFSFGKLVDHDKEVSEFKREDIADSLVNLFAGNLLSSVVSYSRAHNIRRIYLGGNMCRGKYMRKVITEHASPIASKVCDIYFIKTGHTAAFGALLASNDGPNTLW